MTRAGERDSIPDVLIRGRLPWVVGTKPRTRVSTTESSPTAPGLAREAASGANDRTV